MAICIGCVFLLGGLLTDPHIERAAELIELEQFAAAMSELEKADVTDPRYEGIRNYAIFGVARDLQRVEDHGAAVDYLEQRLDNEEIVSQYVEVCIWAGEESRALAGIAALPRELREQCAIAEFQIHWVRLDFETLERRARETGEDTWVKYAQEQRALREGFAKHARRAWWIVVGGGALMAGLWFVLFRRLSPAARTT